MKNRFHLKTLRDELLELDSNKLRTIKQQYANARGGSHEHRVFTEADRILCQREGVMH